MPEEVRVGLVVRKQDACFAPIVPGERNIRSVIEYEAERKLASVTCDMGVCVPEALP